MKQCSSENQSWQEPILTPGCNFQQNESLSEALLLFPPVLICSVADSVHLLSSPVKAPSMSPGRLLEGSSDVRMSRWLTLLTDGRLWQMHITPYCMVYLITAPTVLASYSDYPDRRLDICKSNTHTQTHTQINVFKIPLLKVQHLHNYTTFCKITRGVSERRKDISYAARHLPTEALNPSVYHLPASPLAQCPSSQMQKPLLTTLVDLSVVHESLLLVSFCFYGVISPLLSQDKVVCWPTLLRDWGSVFHKIIGACWVCLKSSSFFCFRAAVCARWLSVFFLQHTYFCFQGGSLNRVMMPTSSFCQYIKRVRLLISWSPDLISWVRLLPSNASRWSQLIPAGADEALIQAESLTSSWAGLMEQHTLCKRKKQSLCSTMKVLLD